MLVMVTKMKMVSAMMLPVRMMLAVRKMMIMMVMITNDNCHHLPLPSAPPASLPLACYRQQIAAARNTTVCRKKITKETHGIGVGIAILG